MHHEPKRKKIILLITAITGALFWGQVKAEISCTYEQEYIDQHTQNYVDASNKFISQQRKQSRLKGMANIQNFPYYIKAYKIFYYYHNLSGKIVSNEVCKERTSNLIDIIGAANKFIRSEKGKIKF